MEIWKDIIGYEGLYQCSNLGRVKSMNRFINKNQEIKEKIKSINDNGSGYKTVSLYLNGKGITLYVHRLVAQSFITNPKNKSQVNHKNGIRDDNRVENLEWCTNNENTYHKYKILGYKHPKGGNSKLSKKVNQYSLDGKFIKQYGGIRDAERSLGYSKATNIYRVCKGDYKKCLGYKWSYAN